MSDLTEIEEGFDAGPWNNLPDRTQTMTAIETVRLIIARYQNCTLPCACYRNPQKHDCQTLAVEIAAEVIEECAKVALESVDGDCLCASCGALRSAARAIRALSTTRSETKP